MLRAFSEKYQRSLPDECVDLCKGISGGFGTGHMCAALVSSVMVLGLAFPLEDVPRYRMELLNRFYDECGSLLCPELKANEECKNIVAKAAGIVDDILERELAAKKA